MLRPMLLVLLELENSVSRAVRMEQARVCCSREVFDHWVQVQELPFLINRVNNVDMGAFQVH